jgi:hypothetical protein
MIFLWLALLIWYVIWLVKHKPFQRYREVHLHKTKTTIRVKRW